MIAIYEDKGGDLDPDDYYPTAVYDNGQWLAGGDEWEDFYPAGTPESEISEQLTGPSVVAVEVTDNPDSLLDDIEKNSQSIGPTQSTLLGVGDEVTTVESEGSDEDEDAEEEVDE